MSGVRISPPLPEGRSSGVEQSSDKRPVVGSNPTVPTKETIAQGQRPDPQPGGWGFESLRFHQSLRARGRCPSRSHKPEGRVRFPGPLPMPGWVSVQSHRAVNPAPFRASMLRIQLLAPRALSSNGKDASLSISRSGFDSHRGYQKTNAVIPVGKGRFSMRGPRHEPA